MSSGIHHAATSGREEGGAFGPRPRARLLVATALAATVAIIVAAVVVLVLGSGGGGAAASARNTTYGHYPAWLPHTKLPAVNQIVHSTAAHPQTEAIEGNTIDVQTAHAGALITAVGPAFPSWVSAEVQSGRLPEDSAVPTTFTVTVIARSGTVPLSAAAFSILTAGGQLVHPAVTVTGGRVAPASIRAGQHVELTLRAKLVEGDGSIRWAPSGDRVLAGWLYQLELD